MITVYVDPWNAELARDGMFDRSKRAVNRDGVLNCWAYLRDESRSAGIDLHTADLMPQNGAPGGPFLCFNIGSLAGYHRHRSRPDVILGSIYLFEPPIGLVSSRDLYLHLPELSRRYKRVYTTSSIEEINRCYRRTITSHKTLEFCYPQARNSIIESLWSNSHRKQLVMINSYNYSPMRRNEFYTERIRALGYFGRCKAIDLYGHRWDNIAGSTSRYFGRVVYDFLRRRNLARMREVPIVLNCRREIRNVWLGPCIDALYETLSNYEFAVCYESMSIKGFISEKLFDCLMVGTIPIYLGAPDVANRIPEDCLIDRRQFDSYADLHHFIIKMSAGEKRRRRESGREFFNSVEFQPYSMGHFVDRFIRDVLTDWHGLSILNRTDRGPSSS
jgi:hypothetical protein